MNEALGVAVGLRHVRLGVNVRQSEPFAGFAEGEGLLAGTVVGHHALDLDAEDLVVGEHGLEERGGAALLSVAHDPDEGQARVVVDGDVDELSSGAPSLRQPWRWPVAR